MIETVVIGVSAGGFRALTALIPSLPKDFGKAIIIVHHVQEDSDDFLAKHLDEISAIHVKEADEKEAILPGTAYIAPAGYHLLVEEDRTFSLSAEPVVNFSRPSIDVLFISASEVYADKLIGVILTGASSDGALGLRAVQQAGGMAIAQNPATAEYPIMPRAAIDATPVDHVLELSEIASFLSKLGSEKHT
jgi:two-component system chemotaxis response regulator CheB